MRVYSALSSLYHTYYWRDNVPSLDAYCLAEKRFNELKPLYVDCFESFCRISVIAATLEGVIQLGNIAVPKTSGQMSSVQFHLQSNGSKPDILKNLPLANVFVPYIDSQLRNGLGHNSAGYDVGAAEVHYENHNSKGKIALRLPYIRFCKNLVDLYRQFGFVWIYASWHYQRAEGIKEPIL